MPDHSGTFLLITILVLLTIVAIAAMKYMSNARTVCAFGIIWL